MRRRNAAYAWIALMIASSLARADESPVREVPCLISQDRLASVYPLQKATSEEFEKLIQSIGPISPRNALERLEKVERANTIRSVETCGQSRLGFLQIFGPDYRKEHYLRFLNEGKTELVYKLPKLDQYAQPKLQFSPDCNRIVLSGYKTQPVLFELKSGSVSLLPTSHDGKHSYSELSFSGNSKIIVLDQANLEEIDLNTGKTRTLLSQKGLMSFACPEKGARCWLAVEVSSPGALHKKSEIMEVDARSRKILSKYTVNPPESVDYYTVEVGPDGSAIFVTGQQNDRETWIVPAGSTQPVSIPGTNPVLLSDGKVLIHHTYGTDAVRLEVVDLANPSGKPVELKLPTGLGIYLARSDSQGGAVIQYGNNFTQANYFAFKPNGNSGGETKALWSASAAPDVKITEHRVQSTDGFEYPGYLYQKSGGSKGVVVFVHGGGCHLNLQHSVGPYFYGPEMLQVLDSGYDVFAVNYRNDQFEGHPAQNWTKEECGTKEIDDIVAANRYVREKFPGQPVFLYGHSQGAYLANLTVTQHAADAQWNGVISGAGMWQYRSDVEPAFMKENYHPDRAPLDYIDRLKTPMLLFHGRSDHNVAFEHAEALMERIGAVPAQPNKRGAGERWRMTPEIVHTQHNGVPINAYLPAGVEHHLDYPDNFEKFANMLKTFLDEHRNETQ